MEPIWMIAAIALGALAYWMDTRAIKIKARHRIDCTANGHSLIILPDGRRMGIGVTSIETSSVVDDVDRIVVEGFLHTPDGRRFLAGQEVGKKRRGFSAGFEVEFDGGKKYKAGTVVHDTRGKRVVKARRVPSTPPEHTFKPISWDADIGKHRTVEIDGEFFTAQGR